MINIWDRRRWTGGGGSSSPLGWRSPIPVAARGDYRCGFMFGGSPATSFAHDEKTDRWTDYHGRRNRVNVTAQRCHRGTELGRGVELVSDAEAGANRRPSVDGAVDVDIVRCLTVLD